MSTTKAYDQLFNLQVQTKLVCNECRKLLAEIVEHQDRFCGALPGHLLERARQLGDAGLKEMEHEDAVYSANTVLPTPRSISNNETL